MKVLVFVEYYLPGYKSGGPIRTISSIVETAGSDFQFRIVTKDRDSGEDESYPSVFPDSWNQVGLAKVFYLSPKRQTLRGVYDVLREDSFGVLYLNSFFNPGFTLRPFLANIFFFRKPTILCPRGEFSPGALGIKSPKKKLYIWLFRFLGFHKKIIWQATTAEEAALIQDVFGTGIQIKIAQNISLPSLSSGDFLPKSSPLKVVFLSRVSEKKNLMGALQSFASVQTGVRFDVYGPTSRAEDIAYLKECQRVASALPKNIDVRFCSEIHHDDVATTLSRYDLFFLPTLGENFGHAILEALAAGLPILIGNTTPWRNLEEAGVGWDIDPYDHAAFADAIESVAKLSPEDHLYMRKKALAYATGYVENSEAVEQTKALFQFALNSSEQK
ncbi:Glycosyltransferase involved in cell wall bisynthesis [Geoalkalibacter ferrihydriticus]|uniref:Glycosyltransferase involved in cell wall bisynthesis n=1 Tax=Geoalkalibacter ferrihydriticus TaxID=392333 RepID=A0A1G9X660_9BACT|nr:glycosyltransferase [Geoalkalibacter ferrihydriticus]SDM92177.1 Glycosyltransferase involved in cell wall bisynthesis [Geoalkalibacter ferrihydriticus]